MLRPTMVVMVIVTVMAVGIADLLPMSALAVAGDVAPGVVCGLRGAGNDLVQFAAIQPDAATLRTVVDLDALTL
jgi:hypothetical protein